MNRELEVLDFVDAMQPESILVDAGACEGRFTLYAAMRGHRVYAFEPERMNYAALLTNLDANAPGVKSRAIPINVALSNYVGEGDLRIGQPWAGGHHRSLEQGPGRKDMEFKTIETQSVVVRTLDSMIESGMLPQPDYLKVDVDGSEVPFVEGSRHCLKNPRLVAVMFELHEKDASYAVVHDDLIRDGFTVHSRTVVEPGLFNIWFRR
jgi:FkbM family methyltransferase